MEEFNNNILKLMDNIDRTKKEKSIAKKLINNYIIEKQFIAYYLYRIWIKYRSLMENVNTKTEFRKILKYLEIPVKYHSIKITYPLCNKMINNEKQLNLVIYSILKHFNKVEQIYGDKAKLGDKPKNLKPKNKYYDNFNRLIRFKSFGSIVQDIVELKMFVPNLSRPSSRINVWDTYLPLIDA